MPALPPRRSCASATAAARPSSARPARSDGRRHRSRRRVHVFVSGRVQGVWFRESCREQAVALGRERLGAQPRPTVGSRPCFEGPPAAVDRVVAWCREGPRRARVDGVEVGRRGARRRGRVPGPLGRSRPARTVGLRRAASERRDDRYRGTLRPQLGDARSVFLKSLTLRGFKSFADKTMLEFEPGVTVVVGPNGSGKSNLVDAVAWVLGAQGPRTLRGGKMDDVIFAGTPDRPALGRAEVSLTIDNTRGPAADRVLRGHDHPHAVPQRRLRVPDQRRAVPAARHPGAAVRHRHRPPAARDRRAGPARRGAERRAPRTAARSIEEAAGILKFRKRRERAERRLESTEGNLLRLNDLLREVRRQLTPLQKPGRRGPASRRARRRAAGDPPPPRRPRARRAAGASIERLRDHGDRARPHARRVVQARLRELDVAVLDAERALTSTRRRRRRRRARAGRVDARARARVCTRCSPRSGAGSSASSPPPPTKASSRRSSPTPARCAASSPRSSTTRPSSGPSCSRSSRPSDLAAARATLEPTARSRRCAAAERPLARAPRTTPAAGRRRGAEALGRGARRRPRRAARRRRSARRSIDGCRSGALVDHLEIDAGAEAAVAAALGDAMRAVVVDGDAAARDAVERLDGGDAQALLLVVLDAAATPRRDGATLVPAGTRALADLVRAPCPASPARCAGSSPASVLVDGDWRARARPRARRTRSSSP